MTTSIRRNMSMALVALSTVFLLAVYGEIQAADVPLFSENFNGFAAAPQNSTLEQFQSGRPIANLGDLADWSKSGANTVHAVNTADIQGADIAVMFWQNDVITQGSAIVGSNNSGETYTVDFLASPTVYANSGAATAAGDGMLIEVLRSDNSVLNSYSSIPGAWAGNLNLAPDSFSYTGDGSGDIRVRVSPMVTGQGRFVGALDNFSVTGTAGQIFTDDFNDVNNETFTTVQFQTGLPVAWGGDLPGWVNTGGGAGVANVVEVSPPPGVPADVAVMFWADRVITMNAPIAGSNFASETYNVDFLVSPAVYGNGGSATADGDGMRIELVRNDGTVLDSYESIPGAWGGNMNLVSDSFSYTGDGSGDIRVRVGPMVTGQGRFVGALDDFTVTSVIDGPIFADDFNDVNSPTFTGGQFDSGLPVAWGGILPGWVISGANNAADVVELSPAPVGNDDFAVMFWQDNVITLNDPIAGANDAGQSYRVEFEASPAVYTNGGAATEAGDGMLIELLLSDDTVVASTVVEPGAWAGDTSLVSGSFDYVGDGNGDVRLRIGPSSSSFNGGNWAGTIDNLSVHVVPEPSSLALISLAIAGLGLIGWKRNRA